MTTETDTVAGQEPAPNVDVASPESQTTTPAPAEKPEGDQPSAERKPESSDTQAEKPESDESPEQPNNRTAKGRISQLYAEKKTYEARALSAERRAEMAERRLADIRKTSVDNLPIDQQDAHRLKEVMAADRLEQERQAANDEWRQAGAKRVETFRAKVEAARERMPDFDQVFHDNLPISDHMADLIAESDKGAEVAYWLGKNPAKAAEIARLPAHLQGAEIARVEARISTVSTRKLSNAPNPPPVLNGQTSPGSKDPGAMSQAEFNKWYDSQLKAQAR